MEFKFTKQERDIRKAVRKFAQKELAAKELDKLNHVPKDILEMIGGLGLLGLKIPEEYGGVQSSWVEMGIVAEEIAGGNTAVAYLMMLSWAAGQILVNHGTQEAKEQWLPGLCRGTKSGCFSVTEPGCGSDYTEIMTRAVREDDFFLLKGKKGPVSFGLDADFVILFARTDLDSETGGIMAFLVPLDLPGITRTSVSNMGLLPSASVHLMLDDVKVPAAYRVGEPGEGLDFNASLGLSSDFYRILSGLIPLGVAQTALNSAVTHAKERMAFGRPIAQFQAVSGKIAEDATLIDMGRWLCYRALWLKDQGSPNAKEAAMCSWWCPKSAYQVIENALLIHGHVGYSDEYPLQQMLRDVVAFEMIGGTEEAMKLIIAQKVIGKGVIPDGFLGKVI